MKLLIISALILIGSVARADLDRLVLDNNNQLHQVAAPQTIYNHPDVDIYNSDGSSSQFKGNMIYNSDGSSSRVETSGSEISVYDVGN